MLFNILKLIRVRHWIKNTFVFIPIFVSGNLFVYPTSIKTIIGFIIFCLASSAVYIFNDFADLDRDKNHPVKRKRPLSSGKISKSFGVIILLIILIIICIIFFLNSFTGCLIIGIYFLLNIFYTLYLKHIEIIDVICISTGFVLRVLLGVHYASLDTSFWLIALTFTLSMLLALGKRKAEIKNKKHTIVRPSLGKYNLEVISNLQGVFVSVTIVFYVMYTIFNQTFPGDKELLFYSSIFVVAGLGRYMVITSSEFMIEEPTNIFYQDRFILTTVIGWTLYLFICLYFS